eukprot:TRINITY_DN14822_c0_g1_i1.p1 TRINITY_DN14822_c0_g1~~TRINITY_DN14822_c0_g1_i1.p1  ORF type:complete len:663 (+),score=119.41 TRINITY_DN14822_c0_g1_i1:58-1989(+)
MSVHQSSRRTIDVSDAVFAPELEQAVLRGELWQEAFHGEREAGRRCLDDVKADFEGAREQLKQAYGMKEKQLAAKFDLERRSLEMELKTERARRQESESAANQYKQQLLLLSNDVDLGVRNTEEVEHLNKEIQVLKRKIAEAEEAKAACTASAEQKISKQEVAIKTASVTLQSQSEYIADLDQKVAALTRELNSVKSNKVHTERLASQAESDASRIGVLEARVVSLLAQLEDKTEELKRLQNSREYEVRQLDSLLKQEAERSSSSMKEHLRVVKQVEETANEEVKKLQAVVKDLLQQQKQRETLCDTLRKQLNERDIVVTELRAKLNTQNTSKTDDHDVLSVHQELWHAERLRLESVISEKTVAFNTLKQGLSSMITQLEVRLVADAKARTEERKCWQARVQNLETALKQLQSNEPVVVAQQQPNPKPRDTPQKQTPTPKLEEVMKQLKGVGVGANVSFVNEGSTVRQHPVGATESSLDTSVISVHHENERSAQGERDHGVEQDILGKIESHLSRMFAVKEESEEGRLHRELYEQKAQLNHLSKKYKVAKGKLARESKEKQELANELTNLATTLDTSKRTQQTGRRSASAPRPPFNTGPFTKPSPQLKSIRRQREQPTPSIVSAPRNMSTPSGVQPRCTWGAR